MRGPLLRCGARKAQAPKFGGPQDEDLLGSTDRLSPAPGLIADHHLNSIGQLEGTEYRATHSADRRLQVELDA